MATDLNQARALAAAQGRLVKAKAAGVDAAHIAAAEKAIAKFSGEATPTVTPTPEVTTPTVTEPVTPTTDTSIDTARTQLEELRGKQEDILGQIKEQQTSGGDVRQTAFDRLFGEDSRISSFYSPEISKVEEQITDVTGLLDKLEGDIIERHEDVGLTEAQRRRIEAVEREPLTEQLSELTTSYDKLTTGLEFAMDLADKEFAAVTADAQTDIDAAVEELKGLSGLNDQEVVLIEEQLNQNLQLAQEAREEKKLMEAETKEEESARKETVNAILEEALNYVIQSGVVPSDAFKKVVEDAQKMLEAGAPLSQIQLGVMQAVASNPTVSAFIKSQFTKAKSGSGDDDRTDLEKLIDELDSLPDDTDAAAPEKTGVGFWQPIKDLFGKGK